MLVSYPSCRRKESYTGGTGGTDGGGGGGRFSTSTFSSSFFLYMKRVLVKGQ